MLYSHYDTHKEYTLIVQYTKHYTLQVKRDKAMPSLLPQV